MVFTTLTYLVFITVIFTAYWSIRYRTPQNVLLVGASFVFYAWWDYRFTALILISGVVDFAVGLGLSKTEKPGLRACLLATSITINLSILGLFKYFGFFLDSLVALMNSLNIPTPGYLDLQIVLPIGISFYTLQTLSYTIDVYRKKFSATSDFVSYIAYVAFFPQLVAGPIERAGNLLPQFMTDREFIVRRAIDGLRQILWGFVKKALIANNLADIVNNSYATPEAVSGIALAYSTVLFSFQIYCDFSGYSDIAIGTAKLFGIQLMQNFRYPYFSKSLREFWRRWHISLSTWFRDYVYIPLGGNRRGKWRQAIAILLTFLISGLWHGASWNFVLWGFISVVPLLLGILVDKKPSLPSNINACQPAIQLCTTFLQILMTYAYVCFAWIFFRADSPKDAWNIILRMLSSSQSSAPATEMVNHLLLKLFAVAFFIIIEFFNQRKSHPLENFSWPKPIRWIVYTILIWLIIAVGLKENETFIYFRF